MKTYVGTKLVNAKPITRAEYNIFRGWELPANENGEDAGYLVEYIDGGKANTSEYAGYVSWSPEDVFNRAYRETNGLNFGQATQVMLHGGAVCRAGWNGKGMFIYYVPGGIYPAQTAIAKRLIGDHVQYLPYLAMKTVQGPVVPWLSSQTDTLANDWEPYQP